jgi:hypothetical protein
LFGVRCNVVFLFTHCVPLQPLTYYKAKYTVLVLTVPLPCFRIIMGDFDWKSTLILCLVSAVIVILFKSWVVRFCKRLWGFFCTRLGLCWRRLLPRTDTRRTPDPEQSPGDHGTELNDFDFDFSVPVPPAVTAVPPASPSTSSFSLGRVERTSLGPVVAAAVPNFSLPLFPPSSSSSPRRSTRPRRPTQFYGR